jgi:hypothetical protein
MKKPNVLTTVGLIGALAIGFLIGISVNFPKVNNNELAGTIGKASNYRNVTITDHDIQLRSDLLVDTSLQKAYIDFFSFHYTTAAELTETLDLAIRASENLNDFKNSGATVISGLKKYRNNIDRLRGDLLMAITTVMNIEGMDAANITTVLNNANVALSRLSYNDDAVIAFVDESAIYLTGKTGLDAQLLRKAHDKLMLLQLAKAIVMNDKPTLKYLDDKELFAGNEQLNMWNSETLNGIIWDDQEKLNIILNNEQLGIFLNQEQLGLFSSENFQSVANNLGVVIGNLEELALKLNNENLGVFFNVEQLSGIWFWNTEQLGVFR